MPPIIDAMRSRERKASPAGPRRRLSCGPLDQLPCGAVRQVEIDGHLLALVRDDDGTVHAFDDACAHQGGPLGKGYLDGETLVCPLHGWSYRLHDGACTMMPALRILTHKVDIHDDTIIVELTEPPEDQ